MEEKNFAKGHVKMSRDYCNHLIKLFNDKICVSMKKKCMVFDIRRKETNTFMNHHRRTIYMAKQVKTRDCNIVS